ncbi:MAG: HAD-IIIC family phosphatase [Firmicutes bacterium]|nr:HAD-IIIC family phosphatase [Bacillota bacterium]
MLLELQYPFDSEFILKKSKSLKRRLLEENTARIKKKIAVLGGSTTHDVVRILELFLLNQGIEPEFYESEYGMYWEDAMFGNEELNAFAPDMIYIHTSLRNLRSFPEPSDSREAVEEKLAAEYGRFETMWEKLAQERQCPVIQNNFEYPYFRLMGNQDGADIHGRTYYVNEMNRRFAAYAQEHQNFFINDINYQSAVYGLDEWSAPEYWHMYKYSLCLKAIPWLAHNVANIVKSVFGKNKKSLVLDLDNTLWGGIVGDDGPENLEIGQETNMGQVFAEFQSYVKLLKDYGVMLNVASKNEEENALAGLNHPAGVLRLDDFLLIKANWEPKSLNIEQIAQQLNILPDSLVFADDNPAEREIVRQQTAGVTAPEIGRPEDYIRVLDRGGYFEVTSLSDDDRKRNEMYQANLKREQQQASFADYADYLRSLEMTGVVRPFEPVYMGRIAQLTNKSNQFNLTTQRFTQAQIEQMAADEKYITLYGKLADKFGDNGVVSVVIAEKDGNCAHIRLWLMSCRVLKRDMELAMLDGLAERCLAEGISTLYGYYYPTAKNNMVREFYGQLGFERISEDEAGNTGWKLSLTGYENKNHVIEVEN